jgi:hypothetical protein
LTGAILPPINKGYIRCKEPNIKRVYVVVVFLGSLLCLFLVCLLAYTFYIIGYNYCARDLAQGRQVAALPDGRNQDIHAGRIYFFPVQPPEYCNYKAHGKGDHHDYPAADIFAPFGIPVVAVTDGVLEWLSTEDNWDLYRDDPATRGGLALALLGDDNVRYYFAHFSRIIPGMTVGTRLKAGQIIGYVGKSGDARYTPPHLHFGISTPTSPGDWQARRGQVWPGPYLDAWKRGEMLTPALP